MKNILVTGGAGFIGSNFIIYELGKYEDVRIVNVDKLTYAGNLENLKSVENDPRYIFRQLDICDAEGIAPLFDEFEIDTVINFAAESHVDRSIEDPMVFIRTNVLGAATLLNIAKDKWSDGNGGFIDGVRFLQVSTDEVYGSLGPEGFFREDTPLDPHSPYSASKASADMIVKSYFDTFKMPVSITRCSNNYGPYQFPEKLIPLVLNNCLNHRDLPVYGDGLQIRDWLYVEDHCKAIDMVAREGVPGEVYNIGGHNERTNLFIVNSIINYVNEHRDSEVTAALIKHVADRKGHDRRYGIDPEKIKEALGWYPETAFEQGIVRTLEWYLNNEDWVKNVVSGDYQNYYDNMYSNR
ncbi:MAG: dTDP-glucose 4,6-dehydratase [Oscillospiraceae bacterium]|nr:dTDP-glucose 4,6-dehydratase [Oscillospiraceae bacterium]